VPEPCDALALSLGTRRVQDLPPEERPRERLARHGPSVLSSRELLAVVIGTGARGRSALDVADTLAGRSLHELAQFSMAALQRVSGLGQAKAARVLAALELGARVSGQKRDGAPSFETSAKAGAYLLPRYGARPLETFGLLLLDVRQRLRRELIVSTGTLTASLVHPREVFAEAIAARAVYMILFHNHPSGDPEPSPEDVTLTDRLVRAGALLGIEVVDHLVLGAGRYVSLRDRRLL
jgi:DNA repair protein RadC